MNRLHPLYAAAVEEAAREIPAEGSRVLITGATGLIGACAADVLLAANRTAGRRFEIDALGRSADRLEKRYSGESAVHCVAQNVTDPLPEGDYDLILHAASLADPRSYALYPVETMTTNLLGAIRVLEKCRGRNTRVLLTSSFEVYGKLPQDEYAEEDWGVIDPSPLRNGYPESKRSAELLFRSYAAEYGVHGLIARLPSVYGPTMQPGDSKAHAQFLRSALAGENIVLKSPGAQKRTYCHVIDAVRAMFAVLYHGQDGEAYNVGGAACVTTIAELAQTIAGLAGTRVVFDLPEETERRGFSKPQNCVLRPDKLEALGWRAKYGLREGLRETLQILRDA